VGIDFRPCGDVKFGEMAFCLFFALWSTWSRDEPISPKGWRVEVAMVKTVENVAIAIDMSTGRYIGPKAQLM
jgi:hypothetical protein